MNNKASWITLLLLVIAIVFVPLIPNDASIECSGVTEDCDEAVGYVSLYQKFLK